MGAADVLASSTTMEIHWIGYPLELIEQILDWLSTAVGKGKILTCVLFKAMLYQSIKFWN